MYNTTIDGSDGSGFAEKSGREKNPGIPAPCDEFPEKDLHGQSDMAARLYRLRRQRDALFQPGMFGDPAWDLLLDLYVSEQEKKQICITSACIAAGVANSTGLRWISILVQNGYVERQDDPADARRAYLTLTAKARNALDTLFEQFDAAQN